MPTQPTTPTMLTRPKAQLLEQTQRKSPRTMERLFPLLPRPPPRSLLQLGLPTPLQHHLPRAPVLPHQALLLRLRLLQAQVPALVPLTTQIKVMTPTTQIRVMTQIRVVTPRTQIRVVTPTTQMESILRMANRLKGTPCGGCLASCF